MSLLEIGPIAFGGTPAIVAYFRRYNLLAVNKTCSKCNIAMREASRRDVSDGNCWWCPQCKTRKSIREGSFFSKSRLTLQKWLLMIHFWAWQCPVTDTLQQIQIGKMNAVDIYRWLREVCSTKLLSTPIILGRPGIVVEIDESLFHHKPKHHRGRPTTQQIWVFGMVDTSHSPALGFVEVVQTREAATLLPIIRQHIAPGSTVHSDEWRAYNRIQSSSGLTHGVVNHSLHFVDPTSDDAFFNIMRDIAQQYPV